MQKIIKDYIILNVQSISYTVPRTTDNITGNFYADDTVSSDQDVDWNTFSILLIALQQLLMSIDIFPSLMKELFCFSFIYFGEK